MRQWLGASEGVRSRIGVGVIDMIVREGLCPGFQFGV